MDTRRYYIRHPRGRANEYIVAVARTPEAVGAYKVVDGWTRATRNEAISRARYRGDAATEAMVGYRIDLLPAAKRDWLAAVLGVRSA